MKKVSINFDLDGTIVDFYGVENYIDYLKANDPYPYIHAAPLLNLSLLARRLNQLQRMGYEINIISWLARNSNPVYDLDVTIAKLHWLQRHLPSVRWDKINIVPYGTPKYRFAEDGILFDDEAKNRDSWNCGKAYDVDNILDILSTMVKEAV